MPSRPNPDGADRRDGMQIATVAKLLGVPVPTIRSWERRYQFPAPPRTDGRHRRYRDIELAQLRALRDLVTAGHSTKDAVTRIRTAAKAATPDASPAQPLINAALALDSTALRTALDAATEHLGVEDTIRRAVLPAMRELGSRWQTGSCDVGREHLATEAVRAWLARQTFLAPPPFRPHPIVLACGPKDMHTIGLESFAVILARRGWPTRVLGAITPTQALVTTIQALRATAAVITAQRNLTRRTAADSIRAVHALPDVHAFYAGNAFTAPPTRNNIPGTYLGEDLIQAAHLIESTLP